MSTYQNLFTVIRAALTGCAGQLEQPVDYGALERLGRRHQILPLLYVGLSKCGADAQMLRPIADRAMQAVCFDQNQLYCLEQVRTLLTEHGLDFMLLKGSSLKRLYPSSELRLMSDIDILVRDEQYERLRPLMREAGFAEGMQTDHELMWRDRNGMLIEFHRRLIPSYNSDYYAYFRDPWEKAERRAACEYAMRPEDEYLYVFTHLTKHYRDGGIGLRHMLDLWMFRRAYPKLDRAYLERELRRLELEAFHRNILATVAVWLDGRQETELTRAITERILVSGAFGIREAFDAANAARQSAKTADIHAAKQRSLRRLVFLPYSSMKKRYPMLERFPVLLPVMWTARWFDAVLHRRDHIARQYERLEQINPTVVDAYNRELAQVGLKFERTADGH